EDHEPVALRGERALHALQIHRDGAPQEGPGLRVERTREEVVGGRVADVEPERGIEDGEIDERRCVGSLREERKEDREHGAITLPCPRLSREVRMAKARRTTHRSSRGKKLYAVRDSRGRFKDIQTYERAHRADLSKRSKAEKAKAKKAGRKRRRAR